VNQRSDPAWMISYISSNILRKDSEYVKFVKRKPFGFSGYGAGMMRNHER
jgi:hypothetical protein